MKPRNDINYNEAFSHISYNPETGIFIRLDAGNLLSSRNGLIGEIAGTLNSKGYVIIGVNRRRYVAHRLAWLFMTGTWPDAEIDHENLDKTDNRWSNLRQATHGQNNQNVGLSKNNTSQYKGVSYIPRLASWRATISSSGKQHHLGVFSSKEDAARAYYKAALRFHGDFAKAYDL